VVVVGAVVEGVEVMVEGTGEVMVKGLLVVVVGVWGPQDLDQAHQDRGRVDQVQRVLQALLRPRPRRRLRVLLDPAPPRGFQMFCCQYRYLGFGHVLVDFYFCASFRVFVFAHLKHLK
jgi:hypothetical protein